MSQISEAPVPVWPLSSNDLTQTTAEHHPITDINLVLQLHHFLSPHMWSCINHRAQSEADTHTAGGRQSFLSAFRFSPL